jgi:hypothetical protein
MVSIAPTTTTSHASPAAALAPMPMSGSVATASPAAAAATASGGGGGGGSGDDMSAYDPSATATSGSSPPTQPTAPGGNAGFNATLSSIIARGGAPMPGMAAAAPSPNSGVSASDPSSNYSTVAGGGGAAPNATGMGGAPKLSVQIPPQNHVALSGQPSGGTTPATPMTPMSPMTPHTPKTPSVSQPGSGRQLLIINGYTQGIVMADWQEHAEGLLPLMRGEPVWITRKHPDGWYEGWKTGGRRGFFPGTYVSETTV